MGIFKRKEKPTETPAKRPACDIADAQTANIAGGASELGNTVTDASGAAVGSSSGATPTGPVNDILLQVPVCEVHKVSFCRSIRYKRARLGGTELQRSRAATNGVCQG